MSIPTGLKLAFLFDKEIIAPLHHAGVQTYGDLLNHLSDGKTLQCIPDIDNEFAAALQEFVEKQMISTLNYLSTDKDHVLVIDTSTMSPVNREVIRSKMAILHNTKSYKVPDGVSHMTLKNLCRGLNEAEVTFH